MVISHYLRGKIGAGLGVAFVLGWSTTARAQLRLRGDAFVETPSPAGLVYLRGADTLRPWLEVETATWLGARQASDGGVPTGDVLTLSARVRDRKSGSELRLGRMVVSMGAVRPVHLDGVRGLVRVFDGTTVEAFGGVPVVRRFDYDDHFEWTAGGRIGQAFGDKAQIGASYVLRRRDGLLDQEEAGGDFAFTPAPWFTAAARAAFDLASEKPTDALVSISAQNKEMRGEVFMTQRSPGRMLPKTSLFSMLGDFTATTTGATGRWKAFPRLELVTTGSVQAQGSNVGGQGLGRAQLALDDTGAGSLGMEARRVDFNGARWSGGRVTAAIPLKRSFRAATELEIVLPDRPRGRGAVWPWALASIGWTSPGGWEIATAVEASSSPAYRSSLNAMARVSYAFGTRTASRK